MVEILAIIGIVLMVFCFLIGLLLSAFGMPGVFIIALGYLLFGLLSKDISWIVFIILLVLAVLSEFIEWIMGLYAGKNLALLLKAW